DEVIKKGLEKNGLNSHQLARATNIKESQVNKFITGKIQPDIETARKIQKFLSIELIVDQETTQEDVSYFIDDDDNEDNATSLGDLIKEKLKQNGN
ncbi:MAG: helix-turn-helix domain-containing protein, partial [Candidatus Woesearchaeota archaeon]